MKNNDVRGQEQASLVYRVIHGLMDKYYHLDHLEKPTKGRDVSTTLKAKQLISNHFQKKKEPLSVECYPSTFHSNLKEFYPLGFIKTIIKERLQSISMQIVQIKPSGTSRGDDFIAKIIHMLIQLAMYAHPPQIIKLGVTT